MRCAHSFIRYASKRKSVSLISLIPSCIVFHNDDAIPIAMGKSVKYLHDVFCVFHIKITCRFVGKDVSCDIARILQ